MNVDTRLPVPWWNRLTVRLTAAVVLVLLVIGVPFLLAFHRLQRSHQIELLGSGAESLSRVLVDGLRSAMIAGHPHLLDQAVRDLSRQPEVDRILILDRVGEVKVSSDASLIARVFDRQDERCRSCHVSDADAQPKATAVIQEGDRRVLRAMSPIRNEPRCHGCHDPAYATNGVLLVDLSLREADQRFLTEVRHTLVLGAAMVLITIAALAWLLQRMVHGPLREVVETSRRIVNGDLRARVPQRALGELGLLAEHVNRMTDHLASSLETEELHHQELSDILNAVDDEIVVVDRDHRVTIANDAFRAQAAVDGEEIVGRGCDDVSAAHWPCTVDQPGGCTVIQVFRTGRVEKTIVSQTTPDGVERSVEIHASPVFSPDGEVRRVVEVRRDISERRQLEASLIHSERLASVGLLASGVSHEINNPLAVIATTIEGMRRWLERQSDLSEEVREVLGESFDRVAEETLRGRAVTDRLLHIARPTRPSRSLIDVNRTVEEILSSLRYALRRAGVEVRCEFGKRMAPLVADEADFKQVLLNLLLNSIQAMEPRGGTLRVTTSYDGEGLRVDVEDTGHGIPGEFLTRIYDPFFTTKPVGKGTGLGLFIVHRLVTEMGGTIRVQSRPGEGTHFTVIFAVPRKDVSDRDAERQDSASPGR